MASGLNFFLRILSRERRGGEGERRERYLLLSSLPLTAASAQTVLCSLWKQEFAGEARSLAVPAVGQGEWGNKAIQEPQASLFEKKTGEKLQRLRKGQDFPWVCCLITGPLCCAASDLSLTQVEQLSRQGMVTSTPTNILRNSQPHKASFNPGTLISLVWC